MAFQILGQQIQDAVGIAGRSSLALGIHHAHHRISTLLLQVDTVLHRLGFRRLAAEQAAEETRLLGIAGSGGHVAQLVDAGRAVAVFDGKATAVERQADALLGAVKAAGQR